MALVVGNDSNNNPNNKSYERALAAKMQLVLDQPTSDITAKLCNNDFEGDFFRVGDTVTIVKPSIESVDVEIGSLTGANSGANLDRKLVASDLQFTSQYMTIDKTIKYAFLVSDVNNAEGKWNYESGGLDLAAQKTRRKLNMDMCDLIVNDAAIQAQTAATLGTPTAPITVTPDELYSKVIVNIYAQLFNEGAITADGTYTFGSNSQQSKQISAGIFMPMEAFTQLLIGKYFTSRSTTAADDKIETANIKQVLGMDVAIEPALSPKSARHVTVSGLAEGAFMIVAGTKNTVTEAKKVLPPEKQRSQDRFADEYHGMTIFGRKVISPESAVVAFVKLAQQ